MPSDATHASLSTSRIVVRIFAWNLISNTIAPSLPRPDFWIVN